MQKPFQIIDHTADIGIIAYGETIQQLFSNAALGMFNLMIKTNHIAESTQHQIKLRSPDRESLLIDWLNELLFVYYTRHIVLIRFNFELLSETILKATCFGSTINPEKRTLLREIKAATYHMLSIDKTDSGYQAEVIFDI